MSPGSGECPLWVKSGHCATTLRMSAFGGKVDINQGVSECPLIAISRHSGDAYPALALRRGTRMGLWLAGEGEEGGGAGKPNK